MELSPGIATTLSRVMVGSGRVVLHCVEVVPPLGNHAVAAMDLGAASALG